jgi:hypothetical protein
MNLAKEVNTQVFFVEKHSRQKKKELKHNFMLNRRAT